MRLLSLLLLSLVLFSIAPTSATEINPSVENQPFFCKFTITKALCTQPAPQGPTGPQGPQGLPNFSAIFYNVTSSTINQTNSTFVNVTNSTINSNYSVFEGATFDSSEYAYLPGRGGGQLLNGGVSSSDLLTLNGSQNNGNVVLQPISGNVGIGTTSPLSPLSVKASGTGTTTGYTLIASGSSNTTAQLYQLATEEGGLRLVNINGNAVRFRPGGVSYITGGGSFALGQSSTTAQLDTTGTVRFRNFGAGTLTTDANGNLVVTSDPKLKTEITPYTGSIAKIQAINPITYKFKPETGYDTVNTYTGFDASNLKTAIPEAVYTKDDVKYVTETTKTKDGEEETKTIEVKTGTQTMSISDRAIIAALVNAVKEQQTQITALQEENKKQNERITALEKGIKP